MEGLHMACLQAEKKQGCRDLSVVFKSSAEHVAKIATWGQTYKNQ